MDRLSAAHSHQPDELVFIDPRGRPFSKFGLAALLRSHVEAVGLKEQRPELFKSTAQRKQIRVHDLRGTFVTVSLANDRTESWISNRTGHRSSTMLFDQRLIFPRFRGGVIRATGTMGTVGTVFPNPVRDTSS